MVFRGGDLGETRADLIHPNLGPSLRQWWYCIVLYVYGRMYSLRNEQIKNTIVTETRDHSSG